MRDISMGDDEEAGVEWMETRRQEELSHARDVVVGQSDAVSSRG